MTASKKILDVPLKIINIGLESFYESLIQQGVEALHVDWRPPAGGDPELAKLLDCVEKKEIEEANNLAISRVLASQPTLVAVKKALDQIPDMHEHMILHAGPPITWDRMCGPVQGAVMGALIYEGLAETPNEAKEVAASGKIEFSPCHHHQAVGPMAGVVSPSMWVWEIKNMEYGNFAYCTLNEGLGKVLRFGAYDESVIKRLKWMEQTLGPSLRDALRVNEPINLKTITAKALLMGDEGHNRNVAGTSLLQNKLASRLLSTDIDMKKIKSVHDFIGGNVHFFLNVSMPACKVTMDAAHGVKNSSLVTVMARNGTDFGIRISGLGDEWFVAPAGRVRGLYFPGYSDDDANPDLGDSTITETAGIGGFAMAAAPAIVKFTGGTPEDAINRTKEMAEICLTKNFNYSIPALGMDGTPTGIDLRKVIDTGILPALNTGIAHKDPGIGQIGAGLLRAPQECFNQAFRKFVDRYG
ncbi:MAG: DUF1116 domain-containing protein [Promethearchaeota archaeon]